MERGQGTRVKSRVSSVLNIPRDIVPASKYSAILIQSVIPADGGESQDLSIPPLGLRVLRAADHTSLGTSAMGSPNRPGALKPPLINLP